MDLIQGWDCQVEKLGEPGPRAPKAWAGSLYDPKGNPSRAKAPIDPASAPIAMSEHSQHDVPLAKREWSPRPRITTGSLATMVDMWRRALTVTIKLILMAKHWNAGPADE